MWFELSKYFRHEKDILNSIFPLVSAFFFFSLAWAIVGPIFAIQINEITQSVFLTGVFFSLWGVTRFIFDFPIGILSDEIDTKKILSLASFIYIFIALSYSVVDNVAQLMVLRVIHGFFGSLLWISTWTLLRELPSKKHMEENIGFFSAARSVPILVGPLIGVVIINNFSWEWAFYANAMSAFIMFLIILFKVPNRKSVNKESPVKLIKLELREFRNLGKTARMIFGTLVLSFLVMSMFGSFLPILLNENFSITEIGIILAAIPIPYIILSLPVGKYGDTKGRKGLMILGAIISILGFFMFTQAITFLGVLTAIFIINAGYAIVGPTLDSVVSDCIIDGHAGGFSGITEVFKDIGQIIGPLFGGFMIQRAGSNSMVYSSIIFSLLIILIVVREYSTEFLKEIKQ